MVPNKKILYPVSSILVIFLIIAGLHLWNYYNDYKRHNFVSDTVLFVYPDMTAKDVENKLIGENSVSRPRSLKRSFKKLKVDIYIKPGRYEIRSMYSSVYLARMLNNGWQSPGMLTVSGTVRSKGVLARKIAW
ncbi:MAG: hypothetical protein LKI42_06315, partial [Bacteroidales bacterium]|nr:hypothetical protein [Bacteroidales bacterium]